MVSARTGTSGNSDDFGALVAASARTDPARTCWRMEGMLSKITCTWPPSRSVIAGAAPRYGPCCLLAPRIAQNHSPDRCTEVPLPDDAMFTLPGLAFT